MPCIITTAPRKEKTVSALLVQHGLSAVRSSFDGILVCMQEVDPALRDLPYITNIIEVTKQQAEKLLAAEETVSKPEDQMRAGRHIIVRRGTFEGCHGIIRSRKEDVVTADINYLNRMFAVELYLSDVELPKEHTFWED
jgi:transcription antitermination factor NusG